MQKANRLVLTVRNGLERFLPGHTYDNRGRFPEGICASGDDNDITNAYNQLITEIFINSSDERLKSKINDIYNIARRRYRPEYIQFGYTRHGNDRFGPYDIFPETIYYNRGLGGSHQLYENNSLRDGSLYTGISRQPDRVLLQADNLIKLVFDIFRNHKDSPKIIHYTDLCNDYHEYDKELYYMTYCAMWNHYYDIRTYCIDDDLRNEYEKYWELTIHFIQLLKIRIGQNHELLPLVINKVEELIANF